MIPNYQQSSVRLVDEKKDATEPIIIEEVYYDEKNLFTEALRDNAVPMKHSHLFVFVHGFQATAFDM